MPTIVPKGLHWVNIPPAQKAGFSHSQIRVRATHERPSRSLSQARPSLARQRAEGGIPDSQPWVRSQLAQVQNLHTWQTRRGNRLSLFEVPQPLRGLYLEVFIFAPSFRIPHAGYSLGIGSPLSSSRLQLRKAHGEQRLQRRKKYLLHVP
jgi:hypothetical protein